MSLEHERLLTSSRHSWVGREFSTEVEKMKWIDVPTHISEWLTAIGTWTNPKALAKAMANKNMSVSQLETVFKWFVDHSGHCFTYYYLNKHPFGRRWRMSKKAFTHKSYNYYAKGLASTIQENQFYVNKDLFGGGAINMDNATLTDWYNHVLVALPKAKLDKLSTDDNNKVEQVESNKADLEVYNSKLVKRMAELDIHTLLKETIESHFKNMLYQSWDIHPLAEADDFVASLKSDYLIDTQSMSFDEQIEKVKVANTQMKQLGASVFSNLLAIESAKEQALASIASLAIPTQESEEE
tara:strand:- start:411 stop:1301 length:891 start_codon:yes stop_codon:yes gene_type:complete